MAKSAQERFDAKTKPAEGSDCIVWTGCRQPNGYGKFGYKYRTYLAHRWIYEQTHGVELVPTQLILHSCDNPPCVNPDHLRVGTQFDNIADMDARGRRVTAPLRGAEIPRAKLNDETVRELRSLRAEGWTYARLAERYDISTSLAFVVSTRKAWTHVA